MRRPKTNAIWSKPGKMADMFLEHFHELKNGHWSGYLMDWWVPFLPSRRRASLLGRVPSEVGVASAEQDFAGRAELSLTESTRASLKTSAAEA